MKIKAGFTEEMIELLSGMCGKTFKSYECYKPGGFDAVDGNFRINLGRVAIDVSLDRHPLADEPAGFDELTWYSCIEADLKSEFRPLLVAEPRQYLVDEIVTSVELVRDYVDYPDDAVVLEMDIALIVKTKYHAFVFYRGIWFSDVIDIAVVDAEAPIDFLDSTQKLWFEGEDRAVDALRKTIEL